MDFGASRIYNVSRLDERYEIAYEPTWVEVWNGACKNETLGCNAEAATGKGGNEATSPTVQSA